MFFYGESNKKLTKCRAISVPHEELRKCCCPFKRSEGWLPFFFQLYIADGSQSKVNFALVVKLINEWGLFI